jgi:hypothetical protein
MNDLTLMAVKRTIGVAIFGLLILILSVSTSARSSEPQRMLVLKAGMVNGFANYTTWPPAYRSKPFVIGVMGSNESFTTALKRFFSKKPKSTSRPLIIKQVGEDDILECHILVILEDQQQYIPQVLAKTANQPILTIANGNEFVDQGGHVGFFSENNKLRFAINYQATLDSQLKISSRLLGLSRVVGKE